MLTLLILQLLEAGCIEKHSMDFEDYIYKQYNEMKTMFPKTHPRRVIFTGHSMGCALAAIASPFPLILTACIHFLIYPCRTYSLSAAKQVSSGR